MKNMFKYVMRNKLAKYMFINTLLGIAMMGLISGIVAKYNGVVFSVEMLILFQLGRQLSSLLQPVLRKYKFSVVSAMVFLIITDSLWSVNMFLIVFEYYSIYNGMILNQCINGVCSLMMTFVYVTANVHIEDVMTKENRIDYRTFQITIMNIVSISSIVLCLSIIDVIGINGMLLSAIVINLAQQVSSYCTYKALKDDNII